jgi:hypothetical protein
VASDTLIIAEEFGSWDRSQRRIDLLGVDKEANLVVIELKRDEDGAHMELQAIRYAAMVARMTFDQAVEAFATHLSSIGSPSDARSTILSFLEWSDPAEGEFGRDVRIVLAAGNFSPEITSTVLWLNERDLDITCMRLRPYRLGDQLLLDVEQLVPLPEAADYQIQIKNKAREVRSGSGQNQDWTQYDVVLAGKMIGPLRKRRLVYEVIRYLISRGKSAEELVNATGRASLWIRKSGVLNGDEFRERLATDDSARDSRFPLRYFTADEELFHFGGDTYALTNQWGTNTLPAVDGLIAAFPDEAISYSEHQPLAEGSATLT